MILKQKYTTIKLIFKKNETNLILLLSNIVTIKISK